MAKNKFPKIIVVTGYDLSGKTEYWTNFFLKNRIINCGSSPFDFPFKVKTNMNGKIINCKFFQFINDLYYPIKERKIGNIKYLLNRKKLLHHINKQHLLDDDLYWVFDHPEHELDQLNQVKFVDIVVVFLSNYTKQKMLIETNSEHLLLELRILIAKGILKAKDIKIVQCIKENDKYTQKEHYFKSNGQCADEWDGGFFPERFDLSHEYAKAECNYRKKK